MDTKQQLHVEGNILRHVHFGFLFDRVWFGIVSNLALDMLVDTLSIDKVICGILPFESKVVLWHSHPAAILSTNFHQM